MNAAQKPLTIASTAESENDFVMLPGNGDSLIIETDNAIIRVTQPQADETAKPAR